MEITIIVATTSLTVDHLTDCLKVIVAPRLLQGSDLRFLGTRPETDHKTQKVV